MESSFIDYLTDEPKHRHIFLLTLKSSKSWKYLYPNKYHYITFFDGDRYKCKFFNLKGLELRISYNLETLEIEYIEINSCHDNLNSNFVFYLQKSKIEIKRYRGFVSSISNDKFKNVSFDITKYIF